jgi:hypothetical protein
MIYPLIAISCQKSAISYQLSAVSSENAQFDEGCAAALLAQLSLLSYILARTS